MPYRNSVNKPNYILKSLGLYKNIPIFVILISLHLNAIEIVKTKTISLEKLGNQNYNKAFNDFNMGFSHNYHFDINSGNVLIILENDNVRNAQSINTTGRQRLAKSVKLFSNQGNYISDIGISNQYSNGGIIDPIWISQFKNNIFIVDNETRRINNFQFNGKNWEFNYSIDMNKKFWSYSIYPNEDYIYTSYPEGFLDKTFDSGIIFKIADNTDYESSKKINKIDTVLPCDVYRDEMGFKNSPNLNIPDLSLGNLEYIKTRGIYSRVIYEFFNENEYIAANTYGTEIFHFDSNNKVINTQLINEFGEIRNQELSLSGRNILNNWSDYYSELVDIFKDDGNDRLFLYYRITSDMENLLKYNKAIIEISYDFKSISSIKKIDFIPIEFDNERSELVGISMNDKLDINLNYYRIE